MAYFGTKLRPVVDEVLSMFTLCSFLNKYQNIYSELITNVFIGFSF